jgi:4-diphosphocytidyl-2C-methyl-D-erythritol kinase
VYAAFDDADGFDERRARVAAAAAAARRPRDLAALPPNDLASSPLADELRRLGSFRSDVSGAGPAVYALFHHRASAEAAAAAIRSRASIWITVPAWYG